MQHTWALTLLTLACIVNSIVSPCAAGCLVCSSSDTCSLCDVFNGLALSSDTGSCVAQSLPNCRFGINDKTCLVCKGDFYESGGQCQAVTSPISGCVKYSSSSSCQICDDKTFLSSSKCQKLTESKKVEKCLQYSDEGCEICSSGFPNASKTQCLVWDDIDLNCQFYYKGNTCEECSSGSVTYPALDSALSSVYKTIFENGLLFGRDKLGTMAQAMCLESASTSLVKDSVCRDALSISQGCIQCDPKTSFLDVKGQKCSDNPPKVAVVSIHKIENCFSLNLNFDCTVCYNGYFLHVTKKRCLKHSTSVEQCKIMSQSIDGVCLVCNEGFYMQGTSCVARTVEVPECAELNYFGQNCVKCNPGFSLQNANTKCLKIPDNCEVETNDGSETLKCSKCSVGYHLFADLCQQIPVEFVISFCNQYLKTGDVFTCKKCESTHALVKKIFIIQGQHTEVPGLNAPEAVDDPTKLVCAEKATYSADLSGCDEFMDNQCKTCSPGSLSFTVNNKCKQIAVSDSQYIPLCQVYEHSNGTCRLCQNGYKNLVDNKCYTSNLSNCQYFFPHQGNTVSPQCAVCKPGSQIYEGACYDISTTEADSENCLVHDQFGACIFCRKGFVNIYKSTQTQAVVKSHKCEDYRSWVSDPKANEILACLSFQKNASGDVTCFSCIDGFALDESDKCVPCRPQFLTPNQQDAFIYKASSNTIYCKNDFSNANLKCLYLSSSAADKCLIFAAKTAGALLLSEMDTPSNYVNVLAMHKSFYGELRGKNWRNDSNATISQLPYALSRRKDLSAFATLSKLKHYLYANQTDYDSNTILGGVCHIGYSRDFTGLTSSADDCKTIVKNCDVKARVFYEGKTSHLISCNRCYNSGYFKVVIYTTEQVTKTHLPNINTSLAKGYSADHLPSSFCYKPTDLAERVANCGVYEVKNKTTSYEAICRACLPKYKPTFQTTEAENIIQQCTLIPNCLNSSIGNRCQMCSSSNAFKQDSANYQSSRQTCHTLPNKAANCLEFSGDASDPTCTLCNPGFNNPSAGCEGHWLAECSHFDAQGRCVKCEGIRKIAFYSNVIKPTETGCIPGSFKSLKFCKSQYTENLCFECESGFVLNSEGRCFSLWKVPYCQEYERISEKCVKCKDFYELHRDSQTCRPLMPSQKLVSDIDAADPIALTSFQCGPALPNGISYPHLQVVDSGTQRLCANIGIEQCELLDQTKQVSNNQLQCEVCRNGFLKESLTTPLKKCLLFEPILNCQTQSVNSSFEVVCDECLPGHYIDIRGLCSPRSASPKCVEFIPNFDHCKRCESDYYLNGNTCQTRTNTSTDCQEYYQTMDRCRVFKLDVQFLETRYKAFEINPPTNAPEVQARIQGRILDSGIRQNLTASNRVLEGETTNTETTTTQPVPEATEPSATKGISGCQIYSSENICLECQVNNYLHQNQCLPVDINVPNCAVFSRKDKCASCEPNYFLNNSLCVKALAPNCLIYETEVKCSFCDFTHPHRDSQGQCLKNPDIPNCQLYKTLSECEICDSGYYLTVNRKCIQVSSPVTHCVEYVSSSECSQCETGYLIKEQTVDSKTTKICTQDYGVDPKCSKYLVNQNKCAVCRFGFVLNGGSCLRCQVQGCAVCEASNVSKCLMCLSGYSMDSKGACSANLEARKNYIEISYQV